VFIMVFTFEPAKVDIFLLKPTFDLKKTYLSEFQSFFQVEKAIRGKWPRRNKSAARSTCTAQRSKMPSKTAKNRPIPAKRKKPSRWN